jgi:hypothetical protein
MFLCFTDLSKIFNVHTIHYVYVNRKISRFESCDAKDELGINIGLYKISEE